LAKSKQDSCRQAARCGTSCKQGVFKGNCGLLRQARIITFKHKLAIMGENRQDETLKIQKFKHQPRRRMLFGTASRNISQSLSPVSTSRLSLN